MTEMIAQKIRTTSRTGSRETTSREITMRDEVGAANVAVDAADTTTAITTETIRAADNNNDESKTFTVYLPNELLMLCANNRPPESGRKISYSIRGQVLYLLIFVILFR